MKEFELLKQALDKATKEGVFSLPEVSSVIGAIVAVEGALPKMDRKEGPVDGPEDASRPELTKSK